MCFENLTGEKSGAFSKIVELLYLLLLNYGIPFSRCFDETVASHGAMRQRHDLLFFLFVNIFPLFIEVSLFRSFVSLFVIESIEGVTG